MKDWIQWQFALVNAYWRLGKEQAFTAFSKAIGYFSGRDED